MDPVNAMPAERLLTEFGRWTEAASPAELEALPAGAWQVEVDGQWRSIAEVDALRRPGAPVSLFFWVDGKIISRVVPRDEVLQVRRQQ